MQIRPTALKLQRCIMAKLHLVDQAVPHIILIWIFGEITAAAGGLYDVVRHALRSGIEYLQYNKMASQSKVYLQVVYSWLIQFFHIIILTFFKVKICRQHEYKSRSTLLTALQQLLKFRLFAYGEMVFNACQLWPRGFCNSSHIRDCIFLGWNKL